MSLILWLIVLLPLGSWVTAVILVRAALIRPAIPFLTAVAAAASVGALGGTMLAPLALARILGWPIDPPVPAFLLVIGVLLFSIPGPAFLVLYLGGWFDGGQP